MKRQLIAALAALLIAPLALGFDSGSTGADGNLNPTANISIAIPEDGILNYATINIPEGVTVRFISNRANTPAFILVQGDAVVDGIIDMSGINGGEFGIAPAGGYAGGVPQALDRRGGAGQGPGGGEGGVDIGTVGCAGAGAGYFFDGFDENCSSNVDAGSAYGSNALQPLIGGSGGGAGGGSGNVSANRVLGLAGGGGGGALLLAVSGTLTLNGLISAVGGNGASDETVTRLDFGGGGGGSGGGIRIVTTNFIGSGVVNVTGGVGGIIGSLDNRSTGGNGSPGRARIEAENFQFTGGVLPEGVFTSSAPQPLFLGLFPTIRIVTIAGQAVPLNPTGENDLVLPANTANPVTIEFEASNVPVGSTVQMIITPINGSISNVTSDALVGTLEQSTASAQANLPQGPSTLIASVAFAPNARQTAQLSRFTNGEEIVQVELKSGFDGMAGVNLHTVSGKVYPVPSSRLPL